MSYQSRLLTSPPPCSRKDKSAWRETPEGLSAISGMAKEAKEAKEAREADAVVTVVTVIGVIGEIVVIGVIGVNAVVAIGPKSSSNLSSREDKTEPLLYFKS